MILTVAEDQIYKNVMILQTTIFIFSGYQFNFDQSNNLGLIRKFLAQFQPVCSKGKSNKVISSRSITITDVFLIRKSSQRQFYAKEDYLIDLIFNINAYTII
jgi:hypothetical protein